MTVAIYTIHDPESTPEHWHFVEIGGFLYPVVWDVDTKRYLPYDLEEDAEEAHVYEEAEREFGLAVMDGGVEGADIDPIEP